MLGIVAAVITVFIQMALGTSLEPSGLPFMTLPFCLAALSFVVMQRMGLTEAIAFDRHFREYGKFTIL